MDRIKIILAVFGPTIALGILLLAGLIIFCL